MFGQDLNGRFVANMSATFIFKAAADAPPENTNGSQALIGLVRGGSRTLKMVLTWYPKYGGAHGMVKLRPVRPH